MEGNNNYWAIDYVFNVVYIDSYMDLYSIFRKNVSTLLKIDDEGDKDKLDHIRSNIDQMNSEISELSAVKEFERVVDEEFKRFNRENVSVSVRSEIAVGRLYSALVPYIKQDQDDNLYPTAGEGRKKLLAYSICDIIARKHSAKKINVILIDEPENNLHKSLQLSLSSLLFSHENYQYLFVTTHSPFLLYNMDNVTLVRIYSGTNIDSASFFYEVPQDFANTRMLLNRFLTEAIFANKVLLVEGPSEQVLFEKVLSVVDRFYESHGIYILPVDGVGFERYIDVLKSLKINYFVKTDNDLRSKKTEKKTEEKYEPLGFMRCNKAIGKKLLSENCIDTNDVKSKRDLYSKNLQKLNQIRANHNVFLSKVDLENDLDEVLHDNLVRYLQKKDPVKYLQEKKLFHMVSLVEKLTNKDCMNIYNHYNFECLRKLFE